MAEPPYRIGEELAPETMLLAMADLYGIREQVQELLVGKTEVRPPMHGLGQMLSLQRKVNGQSIEEIHNRSRISRSQLSFYERGYQKNPGLRTIQALSYGYRLPFPMVLMAALWDIIPRAKVKTRNRPNGKD